MPKGRGSNKRRCKYQKDKRDSTGKGYVKLMSLYEPLLTKGRKFEFVIHPKTGQIYQRRRRNASK